MLLSIGIFSFTVLGVFLLNGKGTFLIAGYNTSSKEEKAKYDKLALSKFYGKTFLALSASMVFWLLSDILQTDILFIIGLIYLLVLLYLAYYIQILVFDLKRNKIKEMQLRREVVSLFIDKSDTSLMKHRYPLV